MIWNLIHVVLVLNTVIALPQNIHLPEVNNFSPPEEVNALQNSPKVQRSISDHVEGENTEETIKEVEQLIKSNPELPRLTRGEILDILDNITKQDQNNLINVISKDSYRDPKALMVVKAYTPLGSGEVNVEEYYTKPPITSIVENENEEQLKVDEQVISSTTARVVHFRRKTTKPSEDKKVANVERKKPYRGSSQFKSTTIINTTPRTRSTTIERLSTTEIFPTTRKEIKRRRRPPVTTTTMMAVTTYRPRGRPPPRKEIKYSNHKYPQDSTTTRPSTYSSNGIRVVEAPNIVPSQINYDLEDLLPQEGENQETFMPMPIDETKKRYPNDKENSISEPSIELEIPDHLKKVVADLNLAAINDPDAISVTSIIPPSEKNEGEKIKEILASLGVLPPSSTTTSTEVPDANVVADNLSPDMQELLKSFGLLPDSSNVNQEKNEVSSFNPEQAEIHPESYVGFKPLPEDNKGRKEMEDLLEQFGLLDKNNRKSKSLTKGNAVSSNDKHEDIQIEHIDLDAVPENLQPILREMGFGQVRLGRKIRAQPVHKMVEKVTETTERSANKSTKTTEKQHVFNPAESEDVPEEEIKKLGRLLEIMKKLEALNGTITEDDLEHIDKQELKELISSLKPSKGENLVTLEEQDAPNPIEYDFGLRKNEVKRQETNTKQVEIVTAETIMEEVKPPSIKDLEDSFGGSAETATEALPETTTARRSGFYYLLDWNTFFEIDDQKGKRVNLRFQPKVGDPKQFFSVNVP